MIRQTTANIYDEDFQMKNNMGDIDRIVRAAAGFVALGAGFYFQSWWGLTGLLFLASSMFSWCPPYALFGINTCNLDRN